MCVLDVSFCLTTALNRAKERPPAGSTFQTAGHTVRAGHQAWHRLSIYLEPVATTVPITWRAGEGSAVTNTWRAHWGHARIQAQQQSACSTPPTCALGLWVPEGKASQPREEGASLEVSQSPATADGRERPQATYTQGHTLLTQQRRLSSITFAEVR